MYVPGSGLFNPFRSGDGHSFADCPTSRLPPGGQYVDLIGNAGDHGILVLLTELKNEALMPSPLEMAPLMLSSFREMVFRPPFVD